MALTLPSHFLRFSCNDIYDKVYHKQGTIEIAHVCIDGTSSLIIMETTCFRFLHFPPPPLDLQVIIPRRDVCSQLEVASGFPPPPLFVSCLGDSRSLMVSTFLCGVPLVHFYSQCSHDREKYKCHPSASLTCSTWDSVRPIKCNSLKISSLNI